MHNLVLFCKSYIGDLKRFERFWNSLEKHNPENIPFYACVPENDLEIFKKTISNANSINWVTDQDVVKVSPGGSIALYESLDGRLSQQIIKAEAWRLIDCQNYVCFDSDSVVIRELSTADFIAPNGDPYTVMHQHKCFLEQALKENKQKYISYFLEESNKLKQYFNRNGLDYEFGPTPCIWSSKVWKDLSDKRLKEAGLNIWDALIDIPIEIRWYGEALLKYGSISINPVEPLMKAYLYDWQYKKSENLKALSDFYIGVIYQSNWEYELDIKKRSFYSLLIRRIKRVLM